MANLLSKTTDTSPTSDDFIYTVNDPAGTPADRKTTLGNAVTKAHGLSDGVVKVATGVMTSSSIAVSDMATSAVVTAAEGLASSDNDTSVPTTAAVIDGLDTKQPLDATLTSIAAVAGVQGDLLYASGTDTWTRLPKGLGSQQLRMNAGATAPEWFTASGGGNVAVDIIVAPSGGDYDTLGAALAAATSGQTIFVRSGTYVEIARTITTTNLTIIGENPETTIISMSSVDWTLSGIGLSIMGVQFSSSGTSATTFSGADRKITWCTFKTSNTTTAAFSFTQNNYTITNCRFETTNTTSRSSFTFSGAYGTVSGCSFEAASLSDTSVNGTVRLSGQFITFTGNALFTSAAASSFSAFITCGSSYDVVVSNNTISIAGGSYYALILSANALRTIVSNNRIALSIGAAIYIDAAANSNTVIGNSLVVNGTSNTNGIYCDGSDNTISGNFMQNNSLSQTGIFINNARDNNLITNNRITNFATGIQINASTCDNNIISGNNLIGCTTAIVDSGTATQISENMGVAPNFEKKQFLMKNTSGVTINAGDVVVFKSVAAGDEVTTTTLAGDDKVFGVATATISNNAYGYIQVTGRVTNLKADGTTDIAVGDFLTTFTTAGIAAKAAAGDQAFAIALEAYTNNDSLGVLDALLIEPRLI